VEADLSGDRDGPLLLSLIEGRCEALLPSSTTITQCRTKQVRRLLSFAQCRTVELRSSSALGHDVCVASCQSSLRVEGDHVSHTLFSGQEELVRLAEQIEWFKGGRGEISFFLSFSFSLSLFLS